MAPKRNVVLHFHEGDWHDGAIAEIFRASLGRQGVELRDYNLGSLTPKDVVELIFAERESLLSLATTNFKMCQLEANGKYLYDILPFPAIFIQCDHPAHAALSWQKFESTVAAFGPNVGITVLGRSEGEYLKSFLPAHVPIAIWSASRPITRPSPDRDLDAFLKRKNAILMPINFITFHWTPNDFWSMLRNGPIEVARAARPVLERALLEPDPVYDYLADPALRAALARIAPKDRIVATFALLNIVKHGRRHRVLSELLDLPFLLGATFIPADIEVRCRGKVRLLSVKETFELYTRYRFTLNVNGAMGDGIHDRVTNAMSFGSTLLSDENLGMRSVFEADRDYGRLRFERGAIRAAAESLMADPERAYAMTLSAADKLARHEHFDRGARAFVDLAHTLWARMETAA